MNIVTGYRGVPHITSQQDRFMKQAAYGVNSYVLPIGSKLSSTIDSATQITLADGGVSVQGCVGIIDYGQTEAIQIESGTVGMSRIDLICAEYTKDSNGVEDLQLVVKTGIPTTGTPSDPDYTTGTIAAGDTVVDFPIYRVVLDGVAIDSVTLIAPISDTIETLMQKVAVTPAFWHLFSTGSRSWAVGDTSYSITIPDGMTGYSRFVIGMRSTNFNVEANWTVSGPTLNLVVRNKGTAAASATINGYVAYFNNTYMI